jgi:ketosteroid isomerase-like protein
MAAFSRRTTDGKVGAANRWRSIASMRDEDGIQRTISQYSLSASRGDWERTVECYVDDGVWEIPHLGMRFEGRAAIREALAGFFGVMDYVVQMHAPAVIDIEGDRATARSLIRECGKSRGLDEAFEFFGTYVDSLVRTGEGWKFARRLFEGQGTHYFPLTRGEAH